MRTWADMKRRIVPGTRLVCEAHKFPEMVGTVRTVVKGKAVLSCTVEGHPRWENGASFRWELPPASAVRILDADRFEYDLVNNRGTSTGTATLRFLP